MTPEEYKAKMIDIGLNISLIASNTDDTTWQRIKPYIDEIQKDIVELFDIIKELTKEAQS